MVLPEVPCFAGPVQTTSIITILLVHRSSLKKCRFDTHCAFVLLALLNIELSIVVDTRCMKRFALLDLTRESSLSRFTALTEETHYLAA